MTEDEIIAVVQAFKDGKRVERCVEGVGVWKSAPFPIWNFDKYSYRVAEPKWRDATIDDLKRAPIPCRMRNFLDETWIDGTIDGYSVNVPKWRVNGTRWRECQVLDDN